MKKDRIQRCQVPVYVVRSQVVVYRPDYVLSVSQPSADLDAVSPTQGDAGALVPAEQPSHSRPDIQGDVHEGAKKPNPIN